MGTTSGAVSRTAAASSSVSRRMAGAGASRGAASFTEAS